MHSLVSSLCLTLTICLLSAPTLTAQTKPGKIKKSEQAQGGRKNSVSKPNDQPKYADQAHVYKTVDGRHCRCMSLTLPNGSHRIKGLPLFSFTGADGLAGNRDNSMNTANTSPNWDSSQSRLNTDF